ncbi:MAG TPA: YihY/virulence factor BrkB family protein [Gemmatimonadales bacterium]|nr:YihY/virulence factor BrkB family protein [Gemmatimonadales bacterium]
MRTPLLFRLLWDALRGWSKDDVPRLGASLAYYALLSLAPILVISIGIAGQVFGREAVRGEIVAQIDALIGSAGAQAVRSMLESAARQPAGIVAITIGTIAFLAASLGAFLELQHALNTIFKVRLELSLKHDRKSKVREIVTDRVKSFGMVLAIAFLLLVSQALSAALAAAAHWLAASSFAAPLFWQAVNQAWSLGVITVLFALIYRFLPDVRLAWGDVWIGGVVTALLFIIGRQLIGFYLGHSTMASNYGAAGSIVVLLLWVYYSAQVVLLGAEVTRVFVSREGKKAPPKRFARRAPSAHPHAPRVMPLSRER